MTAIDTTTLRILGADTLMQHGRVEPPLFVVVRALAAGSAFFTPSTIAYIKHVVAAAPEMARMLVDAADEIDAMSKRVAALESIVRVVMDGGSVGVFGPDALAVLAEVCE